MLVEKERTLESRRSGWHFGWGALLALALFLVGFYLEPSSAGDAGRELLNGGSYSEAIDYYHDRLSQDADDVEAMAGLGEAYLAGADFDSAIDSMERGLALTNKSFDLTLNLGLAYYYKAKDLAGKGRPSTVVGALLQDARNSVDKAIQCDSRRFEGYQTLGVIAQFQLEFDASIGAFRAALKIQPGDAYTCYQLGESLRFSGDYAEAIKAYGEAVQHFPSYYAAYRKQGLCYQFLDDLESAADSYKLAILISREETEAWDDLWNLYSARGDFKAAARVYTSLAEEMPESSYVHLVLGSVQAYARNSREAIAEFEKVCEMSEVPDTRAAALYQLGLSHIEAGNNRKAKGFLRDALTLVPLFEEPVVALTDLSVSFQATGDYAEASEILEHLTYLRKNDANLWAKLAGVHRNEKKYREALAAYEKAVSLEPYEPGILNGYGVLLDEEFDRTEEAMSLWMTAVEIEDHVDAMENLTRLYLRFGWNAEAKEMGKRGLEIEPNRFSLRGLVADAERRLGK